MPDRRDDRLLLAAKVAALVAGMVALAAGASVLLGQGSLTRGWLGRGALAAGLAFVLALAFATIEARRRGRDARGGGTRR